MDFYLQRALHAIETATAGMDASQLMSHREGKWSCAEILEHLALTFSSTAKGLQRVAESGKPAGRRPTLRDRLNSLLVVRFGYMPMGSQAPEFTKPRGLAAESALSTLREGLFSMDAVIADCERRFGPTARIANHPILGPLTAAQWRRFHWVHTRHHMRQVVVRRSRM